MTDGLAAEYQTVQKFTLTNPCPPKTQQVVPGVCFVTRWGSYGTGDGQFRSVAGIDVDSSGYVYVTDAVNHNIQKFTNDGTFVTRWNNCNTNAGPQSGDGQFKFPYKIEVYPSGNVIYVSDFHNMRVQKFAQKAFLLAS